MKFDPRILGARCDKCPRHRCVPVPSDGDPRKAQVIWLGQDPGKHEVKKLKPFVGATGARADTLWQLAFKRLGLPPIPREEIYILNSASCMPITKKESEAKQAMTACRPRAIRELQEVVRANPSIGILAMGKWAYFCLTGEVKGIGKMQGFHIQIDLDSAIRQAESAADDVRPLAPEPEEDIPF
jgi:uracil-DNA glycosylase family 4